MRRLKREAQQSASCDAKSFRANPHLSIHLQVVSEDMLTWNALVKGPRDTPYAEGVFSLKLELPFNYPMYPPKVFFNQTTIHPNIDLVTGAVCIDVLADQWSPAWTLEAVCLAVINMLGEPISDSPLNCDAANMLRSGDTRGFNSLARCFTHDFAMTL